MNLLRNFIFNLKQNFISEERMLEAYFSGDSKYLEWVYKNGRNYQKHKSLYYIGDLSTQENFNFLIREIEIIKNKDLKSLVYTTIMKLVLNDEIQVTDEESEYLNRNLDLLENYSN